MQKMLNKIIITVTCFFILMIWDAFAMKSSVGLLDIATGIKIMRQMEQELQTKKWNLEGVPARDEVGIAKYQQDINKVSNLRMFLVPALYQNAQVDQLLPPTTRELSVSQQESLIMFASQMDSEGNVQMNDPYLLTAPINILGMEAETNATSGYILRKMLEKTPMELLEGSDFCQDQQCDQ